MKAKIGGFLHLAIGEEATIVGTIAAHARRGLPALDLPRARPGARARHRPEGRDGRAVRPGGRHLARARRLDAPVRPRAPLPGRLRDRRRQPAARRGRRARLRLQGRGLRDGVHVRRRRLEPGHVRRDDEPRGAVEAAGRVPGGQQPVRDGHRDRSATPPSPTSPRRPSASACPGERVDGMDVLAVRECVAEHLRLAREERQPTLVEALTYRFRGHSAADPEVYRTKEEVAAVARARSDPRLREAARRRQGMLDDEEFEEHRPRRRSRSSTRRSSSPTRARSPRSSRSTTTSTCSATRCRAGTRSTSARPRCTAARTSPRSASSGVAHELAEAGAAYAGAGDVQRRRRAARTGDRGRQPSGRRRRRRTYG